MHDLRRSDFPSGYPKKLFYFPGTLFVSPCHHLIICWIGIQRGWTHQLEGMIEQ